MSEKTQIRLLTATDEDRRYNRQGQLSPFQREVFTSSRGEFRRNMLLLSLGTAALITFIALVIIPQPWGILLGLIVGVPLVLFFVYLAISIGAAPSEDVQQVTGVPRVSYEYSSDGIQTTVIEVADQKFFIVEDVGKALNDGAEYTIYYTTMAGMLAPLSLERRR